VTQSVRPKPRRSAFSAAFLSFLLPGLGQAYAGAWRRACVVAVPAFALLAIVVAGLAYYGWRDFGLWVGQTTILGPLLVLNIAILAYRAAATIDAYRLALGRPEGDIARDAATPTPRRRWRINPLSLAGLGLVLVVMVAGHTAFGYWDLRFYTALQKIYSPVQIDQGADDSEEPIGSPQPSLTLPPQDTAEPTSTPEPLIGKGRLNVLLVGVDTQDNGFRTDSMILVSLDPKTHQVAMFSIPRDTYGIPLQPRSKLARVFGSTLTIKLNRLWREADPYRQLFPGGGADALKQALGYLYGLDIQYYVLVDFAGFRKIVDTLGGVTINVPAPVVDDGYPVSDGSGQHLRVYIPAGIQHMNGEQALTYARSRKASNYYNDYDRSGRQMQILLALQQQADLGTISANLGSLLDSLSLTVHTDMPQGPDFLGSLIDDAGHVDLEDVQSYAFSPPSFGSAGMVSGSYVFVPNVKAIRAAVKTAVGGGPKKPADTQAAIDELAPIVVQNGTGISGQADSLAAQLRALGLEVDTSTEVPAQLGGPTRLLAINGADAEFPATMALLVKTLGLTGTPSTDPAALIQSVSDPQQPIRFVVIAGASAGPSPSPSP
jgi:LCP family protein required for cell wall assembly